MSSIAIIKSLYDYGSLFNPQSYMSRTGYYTLELSGTKPLLSWHEGTIEAPDNLKHGSGNAPWYGFDQGTYALALDSDRGRSFYERLIRDLEAIGFTEPVEAVTRTLKFLNKEVKKTEIKDKKGAGKGVFLIEGLPADKSVERVKKTDAFKFAKADDVVPTWNGVPIIHHQGFRSAFGWCTTTEKPTHTDLVTGQPCVPSRTHAQVKGILGSGGWAPLISAKFPAYAYYRPVRAIHSYPVLVQQESGENFPVAEKTSRTYALGLTESKKIPILTDTTDTSFACWPEGTRSHPVLDLATTFFTARFSTREEANAYWTLVQAPLENPNTIINVLQMRGSKGRIAVLNWTQVPAHIIQSALLRIYEGFKNINPMISFPRMCRKSDLKGSSFLDGFRASVAWACLLGTPFPQALIAAFGELLRQRPISGSQEDADNQFWFNLKHVAAWTALMEGVSMETDGQSSPVDIDWLWSDDVHPTRSFKLTNDKYFALGVAIGLAEYIPVYYFRSEKNPRKKLGEEFNAATASPNVWLGNVTVRFQPYYKRFEVKDRKGRLLWSQFQDAVMASEDVIASVRPILPNQRGRVAIGYHRARMWAAKFLYAPLKSRQEDTVETPTDTDTEAAE
jgi:hypothetical protein